MSFEFSTVRSDEHPAIAALLHGSLVHWYESKLRQGYRFGDSPDPFLIFPQVYEALDPGEAMVAREKEGGQILGVCFVHRRETHFAVGIVATLPDAGARGVARAMMQEAIKRAEAEGKPVRLVSSLLNLDSYSLYTKMGFVPRTIFQDLMMAVPEGGMTVQAPQGVDRVRVARADEASALADFEASLQGIRREKDYAFFLEDRVGLWKVWVSEGGDGRINGVLVVSLNAAMPMLGPGVAGDEAAALAMIWTALNELGGKSYVLLAPAAAAGLVRTLYGWGARNIELHVAQAYGDTPEGSGIVFPTFLPESA
ncbi:GNAT family N-acetyltransferase [Phragmitibacter flavus]|uniref:GNAT family N-acetyltransferase n=1 Tax=Phragmitibacter flavus TaxID=2576071 RepID=A0A5R8KB08_9BACT|nr:GNAT family N-acetyltransferase [Phragmitibacter flavus]TLD68719.1 GNAT family N-acetyltransferase [Phragmitibacter flavus]